VSVDKGNAPLFYIKNLVGALSSQNNRKVGVLSASISIFKESLLHERC
jgi:hypothetical protein